MLCSSLVSASGPALKSCLSFPQRWSVKCKMRESLSSSEPIQGFITARENRTERTLSFLWSSFTERHRLHGAGDSSYGWNDHVTKCKCTKVEYLKKRCYAKMTWPKDPWGSLHSHSMGPHSARILKGLFSVCLWRCFRMKLTVNWSSWLNTWPSPARVGLI